MKEIFQALPGVIAIFGIVYAAIIAFMILGSHAVKKFGPNFFAPRPCLERTK